MTRMTTVTDCTKDIEVISKMCLVQFINRTKSLVAIYAVMSQKFEFACNDGDASGVRSGKTGKCINRSKSVFGTGSSRSSYWDPL